MDRGIPCKFYKVGQPESCKNNKCPFVHEQAHKGARGNEEEHPFPQKNGPNSHQNENRQKKN